MQCKSPTAKEIHSHVKIKNRNFIMGTTGTN